MRRTPLDEDKRQELQYIIQDAVQAGIGIHRIAEIASADASTIYRIAAGGDTSEQLRDRIVDALQTESADRLRRLALFEQVLRG